MKAQTCGLGFSILAIVVIFIVDMYQVNSMSMPELPHQCDPEVLQQVDSPKIKNICKFLENYAVALQQYNREGSFLPDIMENGVKRQDVDHVFLRFGRRRR